jgi:hypothetical protein
MDHAFDAPPYRRSLRSERASELDHCRRLYSIDQGSSIKQGVDTPMNEGADSASSGKNTPARWSWREDEVMFRKGSDIRARTRRLAPVTALAIAAATALVLPTGALATVRAAATPAGVPATRLAVPGTWTQLNSGPNVVEGGTPTVWMAPNGTGYIVWLVDVKPNALTYEVATMNPNGTVTPQSSVFGTAYWPNLSWEPNLLGSGTRPLLIFGGNGPKAPYSDGCIVGDLWTGSAWALQSWSLSNNCFDGNAGATAGPKGVYSAAWSGGWTNGYGVLYRVGVSSTIPATGTDGEIQVPAGVTMDKTAEASDLAGNGDIYVAWGQTSNTPSDAGFRVEDVSSHGPVIGVPGAGDISVATDLGVFGNIAITATNTHPGVWIAYCTNTSPCSLRLWKYGTKTPLVVPSSYDAGDVAIAPGPGGRLWVAWSNIKTNAIYVVRTNKADSAFGPVQVFKTPCANAGLPKMTGGSFALTDLAIQCENSSARETELATQVIVPLEFGPAKPIIKNTSATTVTFTVTDAGDAVAGATVSVAGKTATTGASGHAAITFPKGMKVGSYPITVSTAGYSVAHGTLVVES